MSVNEVFITGASGKIGRFLVEELRSKGYKLTLLCMETEVVDMDPDVRIVRGNLLYPDTYAAVLKTMDTVIHMAAVTHTNDTELYFKINARGTHDLVKTSEEGGVKRFIYVSTRAASLSGGAYSESKLMGEKYVKESSMDWIILRPSEVYGASGKEGIDMILDKIHSFPVIPIVGDGKYEVSPVHISDVIGAIVSVVDKRELSGRTYTVAGPESFEYNDFIEKVMTMKRVRKAKIHIPISLFRVAARAAVFFSKGKGFAMDQIPRLLSEKSSDISLAAKELSFRPREISEVLDRKGNCTEFDKFSLDYTKILNCDVKFSGENSEYFANYKAECVHSFLGDNFSGQILDYGCGVGLVSKSLRRHFGSGSVEITGYDISIESLKEAKDNVDGVSFTGDIERKEKDFFDVIVMANVLHHVRPEERKTFMLKTTGLLKKGGFIFIFEHNPYNPATRLTVMLSVLDKDTSLLRPSESSRLLRDAGLEVIQKKYIVFFPRVLKTLRSFEPALGHVPAGAQYLCIGKR